MASRKRCLYVTSPDLVDNCETSKTAILTCDRRTDSGSNWAESYTKLQAFKQTQYSRLIAIDSDSLLLGSLDELFFVPPATAVMPRAYWLSKATMSSHVMVLTPSAEAYQRVEDIMERRAGKGFYDMEIMNALFGSTCEVIPPSYALLTGEFKNIDHAHFLSSQSGRVWNPRDALKQAKMVHFSDSPLPKPWVATDEKIFAAKPDCSFHAEQGEECREQQIWLDLYKRFREKRNVSELSEHSNGWPCSTVTSWLTQTRFVTERMWLNLHPRLQPMQQDINMENTEKRSVMSFMP